MSRASQCTVLMERAGVHTCSPEVASVVPILDVMANGIEHVLGGVGLPSIQYLGESGGGERERKGAVRTLAAENPPM